MEKLMQFTRRASDAVTDNLRAIAEIGKAKLKVNKRVKFTLDVLLHEVVSQGSVEELRELLKEHGQAVLSKYDSNGFPLGVRAVHCGQFEVLRFLVSQGYDLTLADEEGWTALHMAASMDDTASAALILVQPNAYKLTQQKNVAGKRPLDVCETAEMASLLVQADVIRFRQEFSPEAREELCRTGDNARGDSQEDVLVHFVVKNQSKKEEFAQVFNDLLVQVAASKNYPRLAYVLLETNLASIDATDKNGLTALHVAAYNSNVDMVLMLLQCGIRVTNTPHHPSILTKSELVRYAILHRGDL